MAAQVAEEIAAAFSGLEPPASAGLIGPSLGDVAEEAALRRELAGRPWPSLDPGFLRKRWSSFCYLSAEAYRYYLPALLLRSLEGLPADHGLMHSTAYLLTPSAGALYFEGKDARFEYQTSRFTPQQHAAVCSVLGLGFDTPVRYRCAKALRWGWNRHPHPALDRCDAFYRALHDYTYPSSSDPTVRRLLEQISAAFAETPPPADDRLCDSRQGDEPAEYALEFRGLSWKTLHPELLAHTYPSLSFFTGEAFRYFLPAYLVADLMSPELECAASGADPTFHLTYGLVERRYDRSGSDLEEPFVQRERAMRRFSGFTAQERAAVVAYLEHVALTDALSRPDIEEALERYWLAE